MGQSSGIATCLQEGLHLRRCEALWCEANEERKYNRRRCRSCPVDRLLIDVSVMCRSENCYRHAVSDLRCSVRVGVARANVGVRAGRGASGQIHGAIILQKFASPSPHGYMDEATSRPF